MISSQWLDEALRDIGMSSPKSLLHTLRPYLSSILLSSLLLIFLFNRTPVRKRTVTLLVLGDIGRSPRMMYHAESFLRAGWEVWIVAYKGTEVSSALREAMSMPATGLKLRRESMLTGARRVNIKYIPETPAALAHLPFVLAAPIKVGWQVITLLYLLLRYPSDGGSEILMVQNPPSIPTLPIAQLTSFFRTSRLVIDWHNLGYSILAMKTGQKSILVRIAKWIERTFGRRADVHVFVTEAMKKWLVKEWGLIGKTIVLHDRPPARFRRSTVREIHELFVRLEPTLGPLLEEYEAQDLRWITRTILTQKHRDDFEAEARPDRQPLIVSSTSWTADEDFSVLLEALDLYEAAAEQRIAYMLARRGPSGAMQGGYVWQPSLPKLAILVSGKGPMKADFERQVRTWDENECPATWVSRWTHATVNCVWLETDDYPTFLGSADLGISLHQSSSGLDLPMKVVDMFGCGVPVLSRDFECVSELVKEGQNGRTFDTAQQLADHLIDLFGEEFPPATTKLDKLKAYFNKDSSERKGGGEEGSPTLTTWTEEWERTLQPVLMGGR